MVYITHFAKILISGLSSFFLLHNLLSFKIKLKKTGLIIFVSLIFLSEITSFIFLSAEIQENITEALTFLTFTVCPYLILKREDRFTFFFVGMSLNFIVDFLTLVICKLLPFNNISAENIVFVSVSIIISCSVLLIGKKTAPIFSHSLKQVPVIIYILIAVMTVAAYYFSMITIDRDFDIQTASALLIVFVLCLIVCVVVVICKFIKSEDRHIMKENQIAYQTELYRNTIRNNKEIRSFRHDYTNSMFSLLSLIESGRTDEAKDFICSLNENIRSTAVVISTGNFMADAVISYKASEALAQGIKLVFNGSLPESKISNNDITTIFSNLLDNAIEGCKNCCNKAITISSEEFEKGVIISVSNPIPENSDIVLIDNTLSTSKADKTNHGFGTKNIKTTVKKYRGHVTFDVSESAFTAKIILRY